MRRVQLRVGELAGIDPRLLVSAFEVCRVETVCAGAALDVETVTIQWACRMCGRGIAAGDVLQCPECGAAVRLVGGDEIELEGIELEVP